MFVIKGTGPIANQLAALCEPIGRRSSTVREESLKVDLQRFTHIYNNKHKLISVCQPGKDEFDNSILRAVGAGE
jgi:hypothetical protein